NSSFKDQECHMNCDCGRFIELGNSVFIQYKKVSDTKLAELPQKNVDFGGGLERILAAVNKTPDVFATDLFAGSVSKVGEKFEVNYGKNIEANKSMKIIPDHMRAAHALISSGIMPGNKEHGYVLRRLIRRAVLHARFLSKEGDLIPPKFDFSSFEIP